MCVKIHQILWTRPPVDRRQSSNMLSGTSFLFTRTVDVESPLRMEMLLNFAWGLLAALMLCLWVHLAPRSSADRRMQFVALAVLLLILFPVISVTDDLQAMQNPAETDSCQRRDHAGSAPHSILTPVAAMPLPAVAELQYGVWRVSIQSAGPARVIDHPALASIQNRPPPAA
jgi:hypothetical protein